MATQTVSTHGVMEGGGSYNLLAKIPAGGGNLALPYLEEENSRGDFASSWRAETRRFRHELCKQEPV